MSILQPYFHNIFNNYPHTSTYNIEFNVKEFLDIKDKDEPLYKISYLERINSKILRYAYMIQLITDLFDIDELVKIWNLIIITKEFYKKDVINFNEIYFEMMTIIVKELFNESIYNIKDINYSEYILLIEINPSKLKLDKEKIFEKLLNLSVMILINISKSHSEKIKQWEEFERNENIIKHYIKFQKDLANTYYKILDNDNDEKRIGYHIKVIKFIFN